jgi:hypothetical protein
MLRGPDWAKSCSQGRVPLDGEGSHNSIAPKGRHGECRLHGASVQNCLGPTNAAPA